MDTATVTEQPDPQGLPAAGLRMSPGDFPDGTGTELELGTELVLKLEQFLRELEVLQEDIPTVSKKRDTAVGGKLDSRVNRKVPAVRLGLRRKMLTEDGASIVELLKLQRKNERLDARIEERMQHNKNFTLRLKKLRRDIKKLTELHSRVKEFLKKGHFNPWAVKAEKARQEACQQEAEIKSLKEETARVVEKKLELLRQIELYTPYRDVMEQAAKRGGFDSAEHLADHIMRLIHLRDKLIQLENEKLDRIDELKKNLVMMEDQHRLFMLQKHNRLAELDMDLEETRAEKLAWEKRWGHIQETATKKTLKLGQIKMATLSIYEMTEDTEVNVSDTEKQLDKIKQFIMDNDDIVKRYQAEQNEEQQRKDKKKGKAKKWNPPKRR